MASQKSEEAQLEKRAEMQQAPDANIIFEACYAPAEMQCVQSGCDCPTIKEGDLFLGEVCLGDKPGKDTKGPFHAKCFFSALKDGVLKEDAKALQSATDLKGYEDLDIKDQKTICCLIKECAPTCGGICFGEEEGGKKSSKKDVQGQLQKEEVVGSNNGKRKAVGSSGQSKKEVASPTHKKQKAKEV